VSKLSSPKSSGIFRRSRRILLPEPSDSLIFWTLSIAVLLALNVLKFEVAEPLQIFKLASVIGPLTAEDLDSEVDMRFFFQFA
jgi:hypothetical protein